MTCQHCEKAQAAAMLIVTGQTPKAVCQQCGTELFRRADEMEIPVKLQTLHADPPGINAAPTQES